MLAFQGSYAEIPVSIFLASWILFQGFFYIHIGRRMILGLDDYRILAVVSFLLAQFILYLSWNFETEMERGGFYAGILGLIFGFLFGFCQYYYDQKEIVFDP
jgi:hypothetical protein